MGFRNFRLQIFLRVIGIGLSLAGFAWSLYRTEFLMTPMVFGLVTLVQVIALIYYCEWTLRELRRFYDSFIDSDYTRRFEKSEKGKAFDELGIAFNKIVDDFKQIRIEKEEHYQYLLRVNQHVNVGLICFTQEGRIDLMNSAACELLNKGAVDRMKALENYDPNLHALLVSTDSGQKALYKVDFGQGPIDLAIAVNKFKLGANEYTLVSLQNIRAELDEQEMQAWQKLIRVLTHEIMNSVTPVVSLTTAVKRIMEDESGRPKRVMELEEEQGEDIYKSVNAIEGRGKGLLDFVNVYRDYTKIPVPELEKVDLVDLVNNVLIVLRPTLEAVTTKVLASKPSITCDIDRNLTEQVLINLIKNASEALKGVTAPTIQVEIAESPQIVVIDNGSGVPQEIMDEIFVPFFTTKPKGSGIGLSLSKQIMKAHGGDLTVKSDGTGSEFRMIF